MILVLAMLLQTLGATTLTCESKFTETALTSLEFERLAYASKAEYSKAAMRIFTTEGLPELARLAREGGVTIPELLEDLVTASVLVVESYDQMINRDDIEFVRLGLAFMKDLDGLIERVKFRANHYERLNAVMYALESIALEVARAQLKRAERTSINPFGRMDARFVECLIGAADEGLLDIALLDVESRKRRWTLIRNSPPPIPRDEPPVINPASIDDVVAEYESRESHAVVAIPDFDLASTLKRDETLTAEVPYDARTSRGTTLAVTVAPYLLKQHDEGERFVIRRLLRSVLVGQRHAGIRILHGIGPKIIEVKGTTHGHKRILGCLEGRAVRLIRLIEIKDDGSAYARRIPRDLCS